VKSISIKFEESGVRLDPSSLVENFDATVQAALVNFGTQASGDRMFPTRGTNLLRQAVRGQLINPREAMHSANFAAIQTVFFLNEFGPATMPDKIQTIRPQVTEYDGQTISLTLQMVSNGGLTVGTFSQISLDV